MSVLTKTNYHPRVSLRGKTTDWWKMYRFQRSSNWLVRLTLVLSIYKLVFMIFHHRFRLNFDKLKPGTWSLRNDSRKYSLDTLRLIERQFTICDLICATMAWNYEYCGLFNSVTKIIFKNLYIKLYLYSKNIQYCDKELRKLSSRDRMIYQSKV